LGGCGSQPTQGGNPTATLKALGTADKKCLSDLKGKLEKYQNDASIKLSLSDPSVNSSQIQSIVPKAKILSIELNTLINTQDCKSIITSSIKDLPETIKILEDLSLEKIKDDNTIKKKISNTRIIPLYITEKETKEKESDILFRQSIQYVEDKVNEMTQQVSVLLLPDNLIELKKQNKELVDASKAKDEKILSLEKELENQKNVSFALIFLILLSVFGVSGYFLSKKIQLPLSETKTKDRSRKPTKDTPRNRRGLGVGSGSLTSTSYPESSDDSIKDSISPIGRPNRELRRLAKDVPDNAETRGRNREEIINDQLNEGDSVKNQSQNVGNHAFDMTSSRASINENLTYDVAVQYYQNGEYNLLQPYSRGYYSATSESMMRNREFWENPLELVESYNGLFWIVQTVEPYFLLLPNPLKRIAESRLPGIEYFFETNFKSENYQSCQVVSPAYVDDINGKWVMLQKGVLNFVY
jgi:hypothetical protein